MSLTLLPESPNPPAGSNPNQRRPAYAYEVNRTIAEIERDGISTSGDMTVGGNLAVTGNISVTGTTALNGAITLGDAAADSLTINATTTYTDPVNYSNQTGITAFATGGQASATQLTEEINDVTVCATDGDSVKFMGAEAGKHVRVKNSGVARLAVFPATGDSINALAVNLAVYIQPGAVVDFYAKDGTVWESDCDASLTIFAPTTLTGQLELKATSSAGNTVTTITNASQAAARTYTVPDAGGNADFVMTAGAQSIAGVKTFSDTTDATTKDTGAIVTEGGIGVEKAIVAGTSITATTRLFTGAGTVSAPSLVTGANDNGWYEVSATQQGMSIGNALVGGFNALGLFTDIIQEQTAAAGVTVDQLLIKDGGAVAAGTAAAEGFLYSGAITVSGAGTPQTLNTLVGTVTMTGVADIAAGATANVVINNSLVTASTVGIVSLQTTTAAAGSTPRIETVTYGVGTITIALRNSAAATATGASTYSFSFILFKL